MSRKKSLPEPTDNRSSLRGWIGGLAVLLAGVAFYQVATVGTHAITENLYVAGALRGAIALTALWLAWPDIQSTKQELPIPLMVAMAILTGVIFIGAQHLLFFASVVVATVVAFGFAPTRAK